MEWVSRGLDLGGCSPISWTSPDAQHRLAFRNSARLAARGSQLAAPSSRRMQTNSQKMTSREAQSEAVKTFQMLSASISEGNYDFMQPQLWQNSTHRKALGGKTCQQLWCTPRSRSNKHTSIINRLYIYIYRCMMGLIMGTTSYNISFLVLAALETTACCFTDKDHPA